MKTATDKNFMDMVNHEMICHFPYAVLSVALSMIAAGILGYSSVDPIPGVVDKGAMVLFHSCHFLHIVFAATGAVLTFFRYSNEVLKGLIVGAVSAIVFCILSDVILPYLVGEMMGIPMELHICFLSELSNVLPFLLVGVFNGWLLSQNKSGQQSFFSIWSHFAHIFVSALASMLYTISHGMHDWYNYMGILFILLIVAVVIPCTLSDVVVPAYFARMGRKQK
ncbi:MAG: hypothetical protein ACJAZS_000401 [Alteromonas naphthalenivorans]|jgi:hypothetical protein